MCPLFSLIFLSFSFFQASEEESGKPFQCPICGLVIKRKSYWKRHMVIHTGLKSHQCPLCPFRCARKDNLKSHMKVSRLWAGLPARRAQPRLSALARSPEAVRQVRGHWWTPRVAMRKITGWNAAQVTHLEKGLPVKGLAFRSQPRAQRQREASVFE